MEPKRPFSEADWLATPKPVRDYVEYLERRVLELTRMDQLLSEHIQRLEKRIEELESRLNQNSRNSNRPPSTDLPFAKPKAKAPRKKSKRKKGGQKGHKGHKQERMEPTRTQRIVPDSCPCGNTRFPAEGMEPYYTHQVIELPEIKMDVTHFVLHRCSCTRCGRTLKARIPDPSRYGYGPRLTALLGEMSGVLGMSRENVRHFCRSVFGFPISLGGIQRVIDRASAALAPLHEEIGRQARRALVNHVDETSFFHQGALRWLWVLVNPNQAFYKIHPRRSRVAFEELIQDWRGVLISDDYGVYRKWFHRQTCLAHLIRRAESLTTKKDPRVKSFGRRVLSELRQLCRWAKAPPSVDEELDWITRFVQLLADYHQRPDAAGKLARQLSRDLKSLWLFLDEEGVDPTNNRAERALRYAVIWRKRSYGTQSRKGDRWVERILSVKETCRLQSMSTFQTLSKAVEAFFHGDAPQPLLLSLDQPAYP